MCGISGIYATQITERHIELVNSVMKSQFNRGPDHQAMSMIKGHHTQALFAHNRLSIIDLSEHANQPMWDVTGRYCIVFNGEIYNYIELRAELECVGLKFNTNSDTEVILNAFACWGINALNRLHGPFAFALFDQEKEELWLCRDRFGVRPLFYVQMNNVLYFASTTSALAKALNLEPNLSYVARGLKYLVYEDGTNISAYHNMLSLPSSCYLKSVFDAKGILSTKINLYYDLANNVQNLIETLPRANTNKLLELITNRLERAVEIRLRTDVPLAISLSSGLDSSSVASLVRNQHCNTIGFSFAHPDNKKSEGPLVAKCAQYLDIKMEYVWPNENEMIEGLYKTIDAQDAPFPTLSIVAQYMLYQKVRASGIKVLLGGQGGDEAFMGYKKFLLFWLRQCIKQKRYFATTKHILQMLPMMISELTSIGAYWRHRHRYSQNQSKDSNMLHLAEFKSLQLSNARDVLWKRQMEDITQFSLPTLLRYEDRNAMSNSVESRLPYMDHNLIELALALPETIKLRAGYGKWAIRKIMQNKIPDQIRLARYKRGFDIPVAALLKAGLGQSIRSTLESNQPVLNEFLKKPSEINSIFSDQQLIHRQHAMSEAITLLWLNKVYA